MFCRSTLLTSLAKNAALALFVAVLTGCGETPRPAAPVPTTESTTPTAPVPETSATASPPTTSGGPLLLEGVSLTVPNGWVKVDPPSVRIVEAEYTLPKSEGDEFDGRLTVMAAGGDLQSNIDRWKGEFSGLGEDSVKVEQVKVAGKDATRVDIRGTWKGTSFRPIPPRENYRMLALILPTEEDRSYFIKFTAPRDTAARHEADFDTFVKSSTLK